MVVRVPFHLRRREAAPVAAVLLTREDPAELLTACASLSEPLVFPVAGGFLIVADSIRPGIANTVRLRRLSENAYLPVDADLVPSLRTDEVIDLTAQRGLVFLPNRDPLAFDASRPHRPAMFLAFPKPRREEWEPFPAGSPPADELTVLTRVVPDSPDDLLAAAGPDIGTRESRPPWAGVRRGLLGGASFGLGKTLGALGRVVGSEKLREMGAKFTGLAAALAPRLSESLLGKQEAALQSLLKRFREGNTDDALRHSIPIGEPGRGSGLASNARLPTHNLTWSLGSLLGGGGRVGIWAGGRPETWQELSNEYRKAAQEAADRGDFRRAALIHARLLRDYRSAAEMLARGGLHREAGILFRDRARQFDRAAQEFEKAGDPDEALRLYREARLYLEAGDLLRRLGEEARAIAEFHRAAERAIELRRDYLEAGEILLRRTGRADLAVPYFERGWESRSTDRSRNAIACAEQLIELHAIADPPRVMFWQLLGEAEEWLRLPGRDADASRFFNHVFEMADRAHLQADRGEIRERCRLGLAGKLRDHARREMFAGTAVSDFFGPSKRWDASVVSDADFAFRAALRHPRPMDARNRCENFFSLYAGIVTAAVQASDSGELFVGFANGAIVRYEPSTGASRVVYVQRSESIVALASNAAGSRLVSLRGLDGDSKDPLARYDLEFRHRHGTEYRIVTRIRKEAIQDSILGLLPVVLESEDDQQAVGLSTMEGVVWLDSRGFILSTPQSPTSPATHLVLRIPESGCERRCTFQDASISWEGVQSQIGWKPHPVPGSPLFTPPLAWLVVAPTHVEFAGLFDNATLYWTEVHRMSYSLDTITATYVAPGGFRAACIWRSKRVVGVTAMNRVVWLMHRGGRFTEWEKAVELVTPVRAVACFPSHATNEILVVLADGGLARVPVPHL